MAQESRPLCHRLCEEQERYRGEPTCRVGADARARKPTVKQTQHPGEPRWRSIN